MYRCTDTPKVILTIIRKPASTPVRLAQQENPTMSSSRKSKAKNTDTPRWKIRLVENVDTEEFQYRVDFPTVTPKRRIIYFDRKEFKSPAKAVELLLNQGADFPCDNQMKYLKNELTAAEQAQTRPGAISYRTGWNADLIDYNWPGETRSQDGQPFEILRDEADRDASRFKNDKGSLKTWRKELRKPCECSDYLVFALIIGFAGAALPLSSNMPETMALHLMGERRCGKSTLLEAIQSIYGDAGPGSVKLANITPTRLAELAALAHSSVLAIDELGKQDNPKATLLLIRALIYGIINGQGKQITKAFQAAHHDHFKTVIVTAGENSLEDIFKAAGETRLGGEIHRQLQLGLPKSKDGGIFDSETQLIEMTKLIRRVISEHSGHPGREFAKYLEAHLDDIASAFDAADQVVLPQLDTVDELSSVIATRFRDLVVVARLACQAGVFPVSEKRAERAVKVMYKRMERQRLKPSLEIKRVARRLIKEAQNTGSADTHLKIHRQTVKDQSDGTQVEVVAVYRPVLDQNPDESAFVSFAKQRGALLFRPASAKSRKQWARELYLNGEQEQFYCFPIAMLTTLAGMSRRKPVKKQNCPARKGHGSAPANRRSKQNRQT